MQAKRIQVNEANVAAGGSVTVFLETPRDIREEVNFHNIWIGVTGEPQNADANAQYTWVLYIRAQNRSVAPLFTDSAINGETDNQIIIACGVGSGSNEAPFNLPPVQIKTSRTLSPGDKLSLQLVTTGITAGSSSNRVMICAHTVRR